MLTITTNKAEIKGIADRSIRERTLPITDFWTKRIINLLGAPDSDKKEIMHNLTEGRAGTTDAEREVTFTAGGTGGGSGKGHNQDRAAVRLRLFHPDDPGRSGNQGRGKYRTGAGTGTGEGTGSRRYAKRARRPGNNKTDRIL